MIGGEGGWSKEGKSVVGATKKTYSSNKQNNELQATSVYDNVKDCDSAQNVCGVQLRLLSGRTSVVNSTSRKRL